MENSNVIAGAAREWQPLRRALEEGDRFVLTTHVRPDTDGIGSEIALHRWLMRAGKQARIINPGALPANLALLDPRGAVEAFQPGDADYIREASVIVLDVSELGRLGPLKPAVEAAGGPAICIDHHLGHGRPFAKVDVIDPGASATGVLVYEILLELQAEIDLEIAQALYATLVADTGSFRFSNTTAKVLRVAAELVELGADPAMISRAVLGSYSHAKVRLLAALLARTRLAHGDRLAWSAVSCATLDATGATIEDSDGLVEYLRLQEGIRVAVLFIELQPQRIKISFRSEVGIDVNALAIEWGGGGHRHAAGAVVDGPLEGVVERVIESAARLFGDSMRGVAGGA